MQAVIPPKRRAPHGENRPASRRAPVVSGALPLVGHAVEFGTRPLSLLTRAQREHGELAALRLGRRRVVLMTGPEAAEAFHRAPEWQLRPPEAYAMTTCEGGRALAGGAPQQRVDEQRGMVRPALQDRRMRIYGEVVGYELRREVEPWGEEGEIDLVEFCERLTHHTSTHCLIGRECREDMDEALARVYRDVVRGLSPLSYVDPHLPLSHFRRRDRARHRLAQMICEIIRRRRQSGRAGEDFLQTLIEARYASGRGLSDPEIASMLVASMFAGHYTSSATLAWTLLELLRHPDYLGRTCEELAQVYRPGDAIDYLSLRQIPLTEQAVKESLRLHPPLFVVMRAVRSTFVYRDACIPAGHWAMSSPYVSHRLPGVFAEPGRWDPDRFGPGRQAMRTRFAWLSFDAGPYAALGDAFAMLQLKTILAILLRAFEFELLGDPIREQLGGLVLTPARPCRVRYRRIAPRGTI